jgi:hypothetical protein
MVSSPLQRFFSFAGVLSSHFPLSMGLSALLRKRHRRPQMPSRELGFQKTSLNQKEGGGTPKGAPW